MTGCVSVFVDEPTASSMVELAPWLVADAAVGVLLASVTSELALALVLLLPLADLLLSGVIG